MSTLSTAGIIIQSTPLREADVIVSVLAKELGRVPVAARSARSSKKRFMGGLDLFDCGVFELSAPRKGSGPYTLEQIGRREHWSNLRANLDKFSAGSYCLELTNQFAHEGDPESAALFTPLYRTLRKLNSNGSHEQDALLAVYYNLVVLQLGGFNFVDDISRFTHDEQLLRWLTEMLGGGRPILPYESGLLRRGLHALISFSQEILGRELRSASSIRL